MAAIDEPVLFDAKFYDKSGNRVLATKGRTTRAIMQFVRPLHPSWLIVIVTSRVSGFKGDVPIVAERLVKSDIVDSGFIELLPMLKPFASPRA